MIYLINNLLTTLCVNENDIIGRRSHAALRLRGEERRRIVCHCPRGSTCQPSTVDRDRTSTIDNKDRDDVNGAISSTNDGCNINVFASTLLSSCRNPNQRRHHDINDDDGHNNNETTTGSLPWRPGRPPHPRCCG
jgi:hypothetical protein